MPTILINTNLLKSSTNSDTDDTDLKQDINQIITKLLTKSDSMDSFTIKYDLNDLVAKKPETDSKSADCDETSNCICGRLATLFQGLLNNKQESPQPGNQDDKMDSINSELKLLRKYQLDLTTKFNLILNKLDSTNTNNSKLNDLQNSVSEATPPPISASSSSLTSSSMIMNASTRVLLTGAKKRKFNNVQQVSAAAISNNNNTLNKAQIKNETNTAAAVASDNEEKSDHKSSSSAASTTSSSGLSTTTETSSTSSSLKQELNDNHHHQRQTSDDNYQVVGDEDEQQLGDEDDEVHEEDLNGEMNEMEDEELINTEEMCGEQINEELVDDEECLDQLDDMNANYESSQPSDELDYYKANNLKTNINNKLLANIKLITGSTSFNKFQNGSLNHLSNNNSAQQRMMNNTRLTNSNNARHSLGAQTQQQQFQSARIPPNYNSQLGHQYMHGGNNTNNPINNSLNRSVNSNRVQSSSSSLSSNRITATNNNQLNRSLPPQQQQQQQYDNHQYKSIALAPLPTSSSSSSSSTSSGSKLVIDQYDIKPPASTSSSMSQPSPGGPELDLNELFKGDGPKFLQLELYKNFKPPIFIDTHTQRAFIDDNLASSAYSKSKSRRNFAAHLAKLVFTPRERLECNCNGRFGKKALDTARLMAIRNTLFKYYPCKQSTLYLNGDTITSGDHDENNVWIRQCLPAIDESNRVLKKQLIAWLKKNKQLDANNKTGSACSGSAYNSNGMFNSSSGFDNSMANCLVDDEEQLDDDFELNI